MNLRRIAITVFFLLSSSTIAAAQRDDASIKRWREDVAYFRSMLPAVHPNPFHQMSRAEFERLTADLDRDIPTLADHEIAIRLLGIVAKLGAGDGHSRVNVFSPAVKFHRLPVNLFVYGDGVFVRAVSKEHEKIAGARVVSIDGVPIERVLQRVLAIAPGDNEWSKKLSATELMSIPEVLGAVDRPVSLSVALSDGTQTSVSIAPVESLHGVEWSDVRRSHPPLFMRYASPDPFNRHGAEKNYWYEYLPDQKLLYINYSGVADSKDESIAAFFERALAFADKTDVAKLVIDVRDNSGGNNYLNRPVLYSLLKRRDTLLRPGHFFVIIGRQTFSAAQNFVNLMDNYTDAIFVGEPTGASPHHYGDPVQFELPNSKLPVSVSTLWWQEFDPRDARKWVAPDIAAVPSIADERAGRDPALQAIIDYKPEPSLSDVIRAALPDAATALARWKSEPKHQFQDGVDELNRLAVSFYREDREADAIRVFELNATANPDSWLAHNSLARAYEAANRKPEAIAEFQRALKIDPKAAMTIVALDRLK